MGCEVHQCRRSSVSGSTYNHVTKMQPWGLDRLRDRQKWRAEPGLGWLSRASAKFGLRKCKGKDFLDVETGGNFRLAPSCLLLPGSLCSLGYHCSLPSNKYLLHERKGNTEACCVSQMLSRAGLWGLRKGKNSLQEFTVHERSQV